MNIYADVQEKQFDLFMMMNLHSKLKKNTVNDDKVTFSSSSVVNYCERSKERESERERQREKKRDENEDELFLQQSQ